MATVDLTQIQQILSDALLGTTVLSMKLAGPELEISFTGSRISASGTVSIDTDAWIFVGNRNDFEPSEVKDEEFFKHRASAIVSLYELTGYDVEAVEVNKFGVLELRVGEKDVVIYPVLTNSKGLTQDSWTILVERENGIIGYVNFYAGGDFLVRDSHDS